MIEIEEFQLADGADEEAFLACDKRYQMDFAYQQSGLLRRTTARGEDGTWIVIQLWASAQAADEAHGRSAADPLALEWTSFVESQTIRSRRWTELD